MKVNLWQVRGEDDRRLVRSPRRSGIMYRNMTSLSARWSFAALSRAVQWLASSLVVLGVSVGCCERDKGVALPASAKVVELFAAGEFYDASITRNALPTDVLGMPGCRELDLLLSTGVLQLFRRVPNSDQCGSTSYFTAWPSEAQLPSGMPWLPGCEPLSNDYDCWRFTGPMNIKGREVGTGEIRYYSPFTFPDDFPDAEDADSIPPSILNKGQRGGPAPVIIVRSYALTDPTIEGFPDEIEADEDGMYRCADVYHGYFDDQPF